MVPTMSDDDVIDRMVLCATLFLLSLPFGGCFINVTTHGSQVKEDPPNGMSNAQCGKGQTWVAGRCYLHIKRYYRRWDHAGFACWKRGGHLASLNTPTEWDEVEKHLNLQEKDSVFIGLKFFRATGINIMYEDTWQWADQSVAFYRQRLHLKMSFPIVWNKPIYVYIWKQFGKHYTSFTPDDTRFGGSSAALCEFDPIFSNKPKSVPPSIRLNLTSAQTFPVPYVTCFKQSTPTHVTHKFLACEPFSDCLIKAGQDVKEACPSGALAFFLCRNRLQHVQYSFVCDHRQHCSDNSDEEFCVFPKCVPGVDFNCGKSQCIPKEQKCDRSAQCASGKDEENCFSNTESKSHIINQTLPPPAIVLQNEQGLLTAVKLDESDPQCPPTHFECPLLSYYCLPVYLLCNHIFDCPNREDENDCHIYICPGFYRCLRSKICVHADHMCDGKLGQCPENDDEWMCGLACPDGCVCYGMAFYCSQTFSTDQHLQLRLLNADKTNMTLESVQNNTQLIYLSLAQCFLNAIKLPRLPNLQTLDLKYNKIRYLDSESFKEVGNLRVLILRGNPIDVEASLSAVVSITKLTDLDLSYVRISQFNSDSFRKLVHLEELNLSHSQMTGVVGQGFHVMPSLRSIDISMCPLTVFPRTLFNKLSSLQSVIADSFVLCCPALLPTDFNPTWCSSPAEDVSSCEDLLGSNILRVVYILVAVVSVFGNSSVILFHALYEKETLSYGFFACIVHLSMCNLGHSIYLFLIIGKDAQFNGIYLWHETIWSQSTECQVAGFIFFLSFESSVCIICVSTLYAVMVHWNFSCNNPPLSLKLVNISNMTAWMVGIVVATCPLLPVFSQWQTYSQNGLCIPLPPAEVNHAGFYFTFGIFNVLNIVTMFMTSAGQLYVNWYSRSRIVLRSVSNPKANMLIISQRLCTVAVFSLVCCVLVALWGFLVIADISVSSEVNVGVMTLVPPLQAALNPCLYLTSTFMEHKRKERHQYLLTVLSRQHAGKQL